MDSTMHGCVPDTEIPPAGNDSANAQMKSGMKTGKGEFAPAIATAADLYGLSMSLTGGNGARVDRPNECQHRNEVTRKIRPDPLDNTIGVAK